MHLKKGSAAARAYMAKIRALRGTNPRKRKIRSVYARKQSPAQKRKFAMSRYMATLGRITPAKRTANPRTRHTGASYVVALPGVYDLENAKILGQRIANKHGLSLEVRQL